MGVEDTLAHLPALRRYARLLTGDATRADDLVQDTLERAMLKWSLWQPGSNLRAWLLSVMHNLYLNQCRDSRWHDASVPMDEAPEAGYEPWTQVGERLDMQQALLTLTPASRAVLLLITVEENSYAEAAQILDIPIGTVMSRLHRAREQLRSVLQPAASAPHLLLVKK
jgi:RNA polymerase sigma factor (sigma-70 family)